MLAAEWLGVPSGTDSAAQRRALARTHSPMVTKTCSASHSGRDQFFVGMKDVVGRVEAFTGSVRGVERRLAALEAQSGRELGDPPGRGIRVGFAGMEAQIRAIECVILRRGRRPSLGTHRTATGESSAFSGLRTSSALGLRPYAIAKLSRASCQIRSACESPSAVRCPCRARLLRLVL